MNLQPAGVDDELRRSGLDTRGAQASAGEGRLEEWVHSYLLSGSGGRSNPAFSDGLKREPRWWNGPLELPLDALTPAVGPDPGMEYLVDRETWERRTAKLAATFSDPLNLPPMIAEYRDGTLSLRDGNTRFGAMQRLGWKTCWVIIWYNSAEDHHRHSQILSGK